MRTANFGKCRKMLGLLVRDAQALARLEATHGRLPATWTLETPPQALRGRSYAWVLDGVEMINRIELSVEGNFIRISPSAEFVRIGRRASRARPPAPGPGSDARASPSWFFSNAEMRGNTV
jgi:hypothetical protein